MTDPRPLVRAFIRSRGREEVILHSLIELGSPAVEPLCRVLSDRSDEMREVTARILGSIGDPRAVRELCTALGDSEDNVRQAASEALGRIGSPEAVAPLCRLLADEERKVGVAAATALGRIGDPRAVQALCRTLHQDNHRAVAEAASDALVQIGDPRAVKPLCRLLGERNPSVRLTAAAVLEGLAERTCSPELEAALNRLDRLTLQAPIWARGDSVYSRAAAAIREATKDSSQLPRPSEAPEMDPASLPLPAQDECPSPADPNRRRSWWQWIRP